MLGTLTDEQRMLEETLIALLAESGSGEDGFLRRSAWPAIAKAGLVGIAVPEAYGGIGGNAADLALIMRQLGKLPGDTPFFASAVLGTGLFTSLATASQWQQLAPGLLDGSVVLAPALSELHAGYDTLHPATTAVEADGIYTLNGVKSLVPSGAFATHLIVSARLGEAVALFAVPATANGVTVAAYSGRDGSHDADVHLVDVEVAPQWKLGNGGPVAGEAIAANTGLAIAMASAEAVGAMEELLALTVDYLKMRKQFGVPIGSFQALSHAAVDLYIEVEQAKSMARYAISMLDAEPAKRNTALAGAKAHLNAAARFVGETAVQLHGAVGMTLESKAGRLFQRLTRFRLRYGDSDHCLSTLANADHSILEF